MSDPLGSMAVEKLTNYAKDDCFLLLSYGVSLERVAAVMNVCITKEGETELKKVAASASSRNRRRPRRLRSKGLR